MLQQAPSRCASSRRRAERRHLPSAVRCRSSVVSFPVAPPSRRHRRRLPCSPSKPKPNHRPPLSSSLAASLILFPMTLQIEVAAARIFGNLERRC